jgi:hexosaminidase
MSPDMLGRTSVNVMPTRLPAFCLLSVLLGACASSASMPPNLEGRGWHDVVSIVPRPAVLRLGRGAVYRWQESAAIDARGPAERNAGSFLRDFLAVHHVRSRWRSSPAGVVIRRYARADTTLGTEGYRLAVSRAGISIQANTAAGLFYGVQTLEQLCSGPVSLVCAAVEIVDRPQYRWRGIQLDVSRHFFDVATVERYIDLAAHYKLNVFHWHLTDDQAWRIQIQGYPRLTWAGAYYTQAQIREVVRYAARRNVTVVPEIEMPGHSSAARRAYPYTPALIEEVLLQILQLFPGPYVHVGGDEVAYTQTQTAMMTQIVQFLSRHGRRAVTWDDALAALPAKSTVMMTWHGEQAEIAALARGYDVVVSRDGPLYFDAYQGARAQEPYAAPHMATLEEVYSFNPQPDRAPRRVYGTQANLWTEHIATPSHLFYMLLPRELALAEIAWDAPQRKNWNDFLARLPAQLDTLRQRGYAFRIPNVLFAVEARQIAFAPVAGDPQAARAITNAASVVVRLQGLGALYYTTDGSQPSQGSRRYVGPFRLAVPPSDNVTIRAVSFPYAGAGRSGITTCVITRAARVPATPGYARTWAGLVSP